MGNQADKTAQQAQNNLLEKAAKATADRNYVTRLASLYARTAVNLTLLIAAMEDNERHDQRAKELFNRTKQEAMAKQEVCEKWLGDSWKQYDDLMREVTESDD